MTKRKRLLGLVLAAVLTISAVAAGTAGVVSAETVGIVGEDIEIATQTDTSIAVVTEPGSEEPEETPAAEEPFAAPGGLHWQEKTACWDAAAGAESYGVSVYKNGILTGSFTVSGESSNSYDCAGIMSASGEGVYAFIVVANKGGIRLASPQSPEYLYTTAAASGTALDFTKSTKNEQGAGWSWDADTKTLTLNGANISVETGDAVTLPAGAKIVMENYSSIEAKGGAAIRANGALTIEEKANATGALVVTGKQGGIYTTGALVVNGGSLSASGMAEGANGVEADEVSVKNGVLKAFGGVSAYSVKSKGKFTVGTGAAFYGSTADGRYGVSANDGADDGAEVAADSVAYTDADKKKSSGDETAAFGEIAEQAGEDLTAETKNLGAVMLTQPKLTATVNTAATGVLTLTLNDSAKKKYFGKADPDFLATATTSGLAATHKLDPSSKLTYGNGSETAPGTYAFKTDGIKIVETDGTDVTEQYVIEVAPAAFTIEQYNPDVAATVVGAVQNGEWWIGKTPGIEYTQDTVTLSVPSGSGYYISADSGDFSAQSGVLSVPLDPKGYSDGITYYLQASSGNDVGAVSVAKKLKVDLQPPTSGQPSYEKTGDDIFSKILNILTFGLAGNQALSFKIEDITDVGSGASRLYYTAGGKTNDVPVSKAGVAEFSMPFSEDYTKVTYYVSDAAGNRSAEQTMTYEGKDLWILESQAPTIEISPAQPTQGWFQGGSTVVLTAKDGQSGLKKVEYAVTTVPDKESLRVNGESPDFSAKTTEWSIPLLKAKDYVDTQATIKVTVTDNAGNVAAQTMSFQVDQENPTVELINPPSSSETGWVQGPLTIRFYAKDNESGIAKVEVMRGSEAIQSVSGSGNSYSFTATQSGTYTITVTDRVGNTASTSCTVSQKLDSTAPGAADVQITSLTDPNKEKWYTDATSPTIMITPPRQDAAGSPEATYYKLWNITAGETEGSAAEIQTASSGVTTLTLPSYGRFGLAVYTTDEVGNRTDAANTTVSWDPVAPVIVKINANEVEYDSFGEIFGSTVGLTVTVRDEASGVAVLNYVLDTDDESKPRSATPKGQADSEGNRTFVISMPKDYKGMVKMWCSDRAGNQSGQVTGSATIEDRAPQISLLMPKTSTEPLSTGWYTYPLSGRQGENDAVQVTVTDMPDTAESGIDKVIYKLGEDGEEQTLYDSASYGVDYSLELSYTVLNPINTTLMMKAVDRAGNESAWLKQPLRFSNKAPVITEVAKYPEADVWTKDGVGVTVTAEDEVCTNLQYSFDGGRTWQSSPTGTFNANQTLNAGTIQAKNEAGFISAYGYAVEITNGDTTPPTINSIVRDTTQPTRGNVTVTVDAWDNGALHEEAYAITPQLAQPSSNWQADPALKVSENGTYYVWVRDAAGNTVYSEPIKIENIDLTAPVGTFSPEEDAKISTDGEQVKVTFDEKVTGSNIVVSAGSLAATNVKLATDGKSLTFTTPTGLDSGSTYQFSIKGLTDLVGNAYEGVVSYNTVGQLYGPTAPVTSMPDELLSEPALVDASGQNSGLYLVMQELTTAQEEAVRKQIKVEDSAILELYEIHLVDKNGKKATPTGKVNIVLTYPEGTYSGHEFTLYHFKKSASTKPVKIALTESFAGLSFQTAEFSPFALMAVPTQYTIDITANEGGSVSPSGTLTVNKNEDQSVTVTADAGYKVSRVIVDGKQVKLTNDEYTFENVTANHTMEVQFVSTTATPTPAPTNNGSNNSQNGNNGGNAANPSAGPSPSANPSASPSAGTNAGGGTGGSGTGAQSGTLTQSGTGTDVTGASETGGTKAEAVPKTGDDRTPIWVFIAIIAAAAVCCAVGIIVYKRKNSR